jgi:hypothetical protein
MLEEQCVPEQYHSTGNEQFWPFDANVVCILASCLSHSSYVKRKFHISMLCSGLVAGFL